MRGGLRDDLFRHNELGRQLVPAQRHKRVRAGRLRQRAVSPQTRTALPASPEESILTLSILPPGAQEIAQSLLRDAELLLEVAALRNSRSWSMFFGFFVAMISRFFAVCSSAINS